MITDTFYLKLHPRTALWWEQRKTCAQCEYAKVIDNTSGGGGMRCLVSPSETFGNHRRGGVYKFSYCIDARDEKAPCGPTARLFTQKKSQP